MEGYLGARVAQVELIWWSPLPSMVKSRSFRVSAAMKGLECHERIYIKFGIGELIRTCVPIQFCSNWTQIKTLYVKTWQVLVHFELSHLNTKQFRKNIVEEKYYHCHIILPVQVIHLQ